MTKQHIRDAFGRLVPTYLIDDASHVDPRARDAEVILPTEAPDMDNLSAADTRVVAKLFYVTDLNECSIAEMAQHPQFKGRVPENTLNTWCTKDGWVDARKSVKDDWHKKLESKLGEEITRQRLVYLDEMQTIWRQGMQMLNYDRVDADGNVKGTEPLAFPKSWEGVASSMVKLGDMMDKMRVNIRDDVSGKSAGPKGQGGSTMKVEVDLTDDEAVGAVKAILERRRARVRLKAGIHDEDIIDGGSE